MKKKMEKGKEGVAKVCMAWRKYIIFFSERNI